MVGNNSEFEKYFTGEFLYGEDFNEIQTKQWFDEETNTNTNIGTKDCSYYSYSYHGINIYHGFKHLLKNKEKIRVLSIGGFYGDELIPKIREISEIFILELPNFKLPNPNINPVQKNVKITYLEAVPSGKIPVENESIDLITCFITLHHLPKLKPTLNEINRSLKPKGIVMIREPIESLGDWRKYRKGLTKNERGIPIKILRNAILKSNFSILYERLCFFTPNSCLIGSLKIQLYNSIFFAFLDDLVCNYFPWKIRYHPKNLLQKIQPSCVFYILQKKQG